MAMLVGDRNQAVLAWNREFRVRFAFLVLGGTGCFLLWWLFGLLWSLGFGVQARDAVIELTPGSA